MTCNPLKALTLFTFEFVGIILIFAGLYFLGGDECVLDEIQGLGVAPMDYGQAYYLRCVFTLHTITSEALPDSHDHHACVCGPDTCHLVAGAGLRPSRCRQPHTSARVTF